MIGFNTQENEHSDELENGLFSDLFFDILKETDLSPQNITSLKLAHPEFNKQIEYNLPYLLNCYIEEVSKIYTNLPIPIKQACLHLITDNNPHPNDNVYNAYRTLYLTYLEQQREIKCLLKNTLISDEHKKLLNKLHKRGFTITNMINACEMINFFNDNLLENIADLFGDPVPHINGDAQTMTLHVESKELTRVPSKLLKFLTDWQGDNIYLSMCDNHIHSLSGIDFSLLKVENIDLSYNQLTTFPNELLKTHFDSGNGSILVSSIINNNINNLPTAINHWLQQQGLNDIEILRQQFSNPYHYIREQIRELIRPNGPKYSTICFMLAQGLMSLYGNFNKMIKFEMDYIMGRNTSENSSNSQLELDDLFKEALVAIPLIAVQSLAIVVGLYYTFKHLQYLRQTFDQKEMFYLHNQKIKYNAIDTFREDNKTKMSIQSQEQYVNGYKAANNWLPWLKSWVKRDDSAAFAAGYDDGKQKRKPAVTQNMSTKEQTDLDIKNTCHIM